MKIDRNKINMNTLNTNPQFQQFVQFLEQTLADEREKYESATASEYNRGRVIALRELLSEVKQGVPVTRGPR